MLTKHTAKTYMPLNCGSYLHAEHEGLRAIRAFAPRACDMVDDLNPA